MLTEAIERVPGTRFLSAERAGVLTLWVTRADFAVTFRGLTLVGALLVCASPLLVSYPALPDSSMGFLGMAAALGAGLLLLRSSLRYARDTLGPQRSQFGRVRRSLEIRVDDASGGYREVDPRPFLVVDGQEFERSDFRDVVVLGIERDELEGATHVRRQEFAAVLILADRLVELDRFAVLEPAQAVADALLRACTGTEGVAAVEACPLLDPLWGTTVPGFYRLGQFGAWFVGILLAVFGHPVVAVGLLLGSLLADIVLTRREGDRRGIVRTELVRGRRPLGDAGPVQRAARSNVTADDRVCPRCEAPLSLETLASASLLACRLCGGVWLDPAACKRLLEGPRIALLELGDFSAQRATLVREEAVALCPECRKPMGRTPVPSTQIAIDTCAHGTWFDAKELRVFAEARAKRVSAPPSEGALHSRPRTVSRGDDVRGFDATDYDPDAPNPLGLVLDLVAALLDSENS